MRMTRRRGCGCPLAGGTFCALSQKSTGTIQGFRGEAALRGRSWQAWYWRVRFLFGPPSTPTSFWEAGTGPRHASAYGCSRKNFLSFALALFALGIWCIISVVLVSGSHCSGRLGVAEEYGTLVFSGDDCFRGCNAWFDIGYMFCVSTLVAMDEFHTFSASRQTRILKCCSPLWCRTEKCAQLMLLSAVLLSAVRTLENWKYFYEFHVAAMRGDGQHFFWGTCVRHRCRGAGSTRESDSALAGTHAN